MPYFSKPIIEELDNELKKYNFSILDIHADENEATIYYMKSKEKLCEKLGYKYTKKFVKNNEELIDALKNDSEYDGIFVSKPLPKNIDENIIDQYLDRKKDLDIITNENCGYFFKNITMISPATARAVIHLIKYYNIDIASKNAVVVGRSNVVGKPVALLLLNEDATVTLAHSKTENLRNITREADIFVSAIGRANFFDKSYVKENAVLIDVGINVDEQGNLCGDFNYNSVIEVTQNVTPVPGGIGPLTNRMLFLNLIDLRRIYEN